MGLKKDMSRNMNKLLLTTSCLALLSVSIAHAGSTKPPAALKSNVAEQSNIVLISESIEQESKAFIENLTSEGIGFLSNAGLSQDQKKSEFKKLLHKNFDMRTLGRFSLGRYWNVATKSEQSEYQKLFEDMIVDVYARRFGDYSGQELVVNSARADGKSDAIVSSHIKHNGQKISVDWRVRKKNGSMNVIDVIVEGVSMATTQRSEFSSIIQRGGGQVDALLVHLKS